MQSDVKRLHTKRNDCLLLSALIDYQTARSLTWLTPSAILPFFRLLFYSLYYALLSFHENTHTQTRKKKEKRRVAMEAAPFSFHPARSLLFCYMTEWPRLGPSLSRLSCFSLFFFSPLLLILLGPIMRVGGDAALSTQCALSWYIYEAKGEAAQAKLWAHENEENEE